MKKCRHKWVNKRLEDRGYTEEEPYRFKWFKEHWCNKCGTIKRQHRIYINNKPITTKVEFLRPKNVTTTQ